LRGAFYPNENEIRISDKLNDTERLSTLTHELGHALMHNSKEAFKLPEPVRELEADAVSIMLQQYFGISLTDSRKRHFSENYRKCTR
jgi:Zn-dependent peptidase ImmA (M78 family)